MARAAPSALALTLFGVLLTRMVGPLTLRRERDVNR
jgi:hypothetical protein